MRRLFIIALVASLSGMTFFDALITSALTYLLLALRKLNPFLQFRITKGPPIRQATQLKQVTPKMTPKVTPEQIKIKSCTVSLTQVKLPATGSNLRCKDCGQEALHRSNLTPLPDAQPEQEAVKEEAISVLSWEDSKRNSWPLSFKAVEVSVHDRNGHLVPYDSGLVEGGVKLYLSARLCSILDDSKSVVVGDAGPLRSWRKFKEKVILATSVDGMEVEYHIETSDFSQQYNEALNKLSIGQFTSIIEEAFVDLASSSDEEDASPSVNQRKKSSPMARSQAGKSGYKKRLSNSPEQPAGKRLSLDPSWQLHKNGKNSDRRSLPAAIEKGGQQFGGGEEGKLNKVLKSLGQRPGVGKPLDR